MHSYLADRVTGALFAAFGLYLFFVFIPASVESVDADWLAPESFPNVLAVLIAIFGVALMIKPSAHNPPEAIKLMRAGMYVGTLSLGFFALSRFGFVYVAPFIALAVMVFMGERRLQWIAIGAIAIPGVIWFVVAQLLGRALP